MDETIEEQKKRLAEEAEVKNGFLQFLNTFQIDNEKDQMKAVRIYNFIIRQINSESLQGFLNDAEYIQIVKESTDALFQLIYIELSDFDDVIENIIKRQDEMTLADAGKFMSETKDFRDIYTELLRCDVIFASSKNFLWLLLTRIHNGRHLNVVLSEIESRRPIVKGSTA